MLAICPSTHKGEDFPPQWEVFWNQELSCVSFLLSFLFFVFFAVPVSSMLGFLSLPLHWFSSCSASTAGAFADLGFCWVWPLPHGGRAEVVSTRLNLSHGTIDIGGVCNFLGSGSPQQKFEAKDGSVLQFCVTAQFYLANKGKYILKAWRQVDPKDAKRREALGSILAPLFMFFLLPQACPM